MIKMEEGMMKLTSEELKQELSKQAEEKALRLIAKEGAREILEYFWNNRIDL